MTRRRVLAPALVAAALIAAGAPTASAAWSPARLVSGSPDAQTLTATTGAQIAAGGRYVVFTTTSRNLWPDDAPAGAHHEGGIFRRDLQTGAVTLVARGALVDDLTGDLLRTGALAPSISADGRRVAFTTSEQMTPADTNDKLDVYVRDLDRAIDDPAGYELVDALDGSSTPATFTGGSGASAPAFAALSADGRTVAFTTDSDSDLPAGGAGSPAGQLFVRSLDTRRTVLATVNRTTGDPAGGAGAGLGVALSADGSTVVWNGAHAAAQTTILTNEPYADGAPELLWRRVADGAGAHTRRVAGTADADDPACPAGGMITDPNPLPAPALSPCDGPFVRPQAAGANAGGPFAVSGDGRRVVFVSIAQARGIVQTAEIGAPDAYVSDMTDGLTRKAGVRELTREGLPTDPSISSAVVQVGISQDGRWAAFSTRRIHLALSEPTLLGDTPTSVAGIETYAADLQSETVRLVTRGVDGAQATGNDSPSRPSFTSDGSQLVLTSEASNLVAADGNSVADAFVFDRVADDPAPLVDPATPPPAVTSLTPAWVLRAVATPLSGGAVRVRATTPGAGTVRASVSARISSRARGARARTRRTVLAAASGDSAGAGDVLLRAAPSRRYATLVRSRGRLKATVTVTFRPSGAGRTLTRTMAVTLVRQRAAATGGTR